MANHPCKGRCSNFKDEACNTCLIIESEQQTISLEDLNSQLSQLSIGQAIDQCLIEVFGVID